MITVEDMYYDVKEWHKAFCMPAPDEPTALDDKTKKLRKRLVGEEAGEYVTAQFNENYPEEVDGMIDTLWTMAGTLVEMGTAGFYEESYHAHSIEEVADLFVSGLELDRPSMIYSAMKRFMGKHVDMDVIQRGWNEVKEANWRKGWTEEQIRGVNGNPALGKHWDAIKIEGKELYAVFDSTGKLRKPPSWYGPDYSWL